MGIEGELMDRCTTESNHIVEVHRTLGIEAAQSCIIQEIKKIMQSHSMDADIWHAYDALLADEMTFKVLPILILLFPLQ